MGAAKQRGNLEQRIEQSVERKRKELEEWEARKEKEREERLKQEKLLVAVASYLYGNSESAAEIVTSYIQQSSGIKE